MLRCGCGNWEPNTREQHTKISGKDPTPLNIDGISSVAGHRNIYATSTKDSPSKPLPAIHRKSVLPSFLMVRFDQVFHRMGRPNRCVSGHPPSGLKPSLRASSPHFSLPTIVDIVDVGSWIPHVFTHVCFTHAFTHFSCQHFPQATPLLSPCAHSKRLSITGATAEPSDAHPTGCHVRHLGIS